MDATYCDEEKGFEDGRRSNVVKCGGPWYEEALEDSDQVFCHVGEEAYHEEFQKKDLAKKMKEVKNEMVRSIVEENN